MIPGLCPEMLVENLCHGFNRQVDDGEVPVGPDPHSGAVHRFPVGRGPVKGAGQVVPETLAGGFQDVVDLGLAGGQFQVMPGAPVQVEDVATIVHQHAHRCIFLQQKAFGQFAR